VLAIHALQTAGGRQDRFVSTVPSKGRRGAVGIATTLACGSIPGSGVQRHRSGGGARLAFCCSGWGMGSGWTLAGPSSSTSVGLIGRCVVGARGGHTTALWCELRCELISDWIHTGQNALLLLLLSTCTVQYNNNNNRVHTNTPFTPIYCLV